MNAIRHFGLHCPEDVSVIGFDNLDVAEFVTPSLSSVEQSVYQLGAVAAQMVVDRIHGETGPRKECVLSTALRLRASVAAPPVQDAAAKRARRKP